MVSEPGDHDVLQVHSPLSNAPLFASLMIEWEQLLVINGKQATKEIKSSLLGSPRGLKFTAEL